MGGLTLPILPATVNLLTSFSSTLERHPCCENSKRLTFSTILDGDSSPLVTCPRQKHQHGQQEEAFLPKKKSSKTLLGPSTYGHCLRFRIRNSSVVFQFSRFHLSQTPSPVFLLTRLQRRQSAKNNTVTPCNSKIQLTPNNQSCPFTSEQSSLSLRPSPPSCHWPLFVPCE